VAQLERDRREALAGLTDEELKRLSRRLKAEEIASLCPHCRTDEAA
jgi:hypothetical protein